MTTKLQSVAATRSITLLGVLALVGCGAAPDQPPTSSPEVSTVAVDCDGPGPLVPRLDWVPCGEELPGAECAVAEVPLDYDHPRRETTFVALARIPASDREHRIGSLFINPGGPGSSGIDLLAGWGDYLASVVLGRYDVVGFDPRGVGRSDPLLCWDSNQERDAWNGQGPVYPVRNEEERPFYDYYRALSVMCLASGPRIAPHMSTADAARDLDLLRQAVGDRRLNYVGFSYGSFLGQTYANLFPSRVGAFVIDGVLDPRVWSAGLWLFVDSLAPAPRELGEFFRLCDEAGPENCALTSQGSTASARFLALATRLLQAPFELPDFTYTYQSLMLDAWNLLYDPNTWPGEDGYAAWFGAIADAALGEAGAMERASTARAALEQRLRASAPGALENDNFLEAHYAVACGDAGYPRSLAGWSTIGHYLRSRTMFAMMWWDMVPCADWPVAADRFVGPWSTVTASPVLVVGNYFDGVTGYEGAVAASKLLRNSRLLTYAGWGHTAFLGINACIDEHVGKYLVDGALPPRGTVCAANPNPFLPQPTLRAAAANRPPKVRPPWWLRPR